MQNEYPGDKKEKEVFDVKVDVLGGGYIELTVPDGTMHLVNVTHISKITLSKITKNEQPMVRVFFLDDSAKIVLAFEDRQNATWHYQKLKKAIRESFDKGLTKRPVYDRTNSENE